MTFQILVLCRANVCRSPLIATVLERLLDAEPGMGEVVVRSAGTEAVEGQETCPTMVELARESGLDPVTSRHHGATLLTDAMLLESGLVLAADRRVRSQVIRRKGSRISERLFTLREAAELATVAGASGALTPSHEASVVTRLRDITAAMNDHRGFVDLPGTDRFIPLTRPWRPLRLSAEDVPDAHGVPAAPHRLVHRLALVSVVRLVRGIAPGMNGGAP